MTKIFHSMIRPLVQRLGFDVIRFNREVHELNRLGYEIYDLTKQYTMTSRDRILALVDAVVYLEQCGINGSFVECGVWKGGSSMAMMYALDRIQSTSREIYMYDTFDGMPAPSQLDVTSFGKGASEKYEHARKVGAGSDWCLSTLEEVKRNLAQTRYPLEKIKLVEGRVEETIPAIIPSEIALLRLDTDWYESTKHELVHLFPRLKMGGILILDDYGHWRGARKAVDEFLEGNEIRLFLSRIDDTGRIAVKG